MPQELTAVCTIRPVEGAGTTEETTYELWENFRPTWLPAARDGAAATCLLEVPLATMLALHLTRTDPEASPPGVRLPADSRWPVRLSRSQAHRLYRLFIGTSITIARFEFSLVNDREISCLRRAGVQVDLWDPETDLRARREESR